MLCREYEQVLIEKWNASQYDQMTNFDHFGQSESFWPIRIVYLDKCYESCNYSKVDPGSFDCRVFTTK